MRYAQLLVHRITRMSLFVMVLIFSHADHVNATIVFEENFNDTGKWFSGRQIQWDAEWLSVGNNQGLTSNGAGQATGFSWRGATHSGNALSGWAVGETATLTVDFALSLGTVPANSIMHVFGLTTDIVEVNPTHTATQRNGDVLGFELEQAAWTGPTGTEYPGGRMKVEPQEDGAIANFSLMSAWGLAVGDTQSDNMRITWSATKTATLDEFLVDVTVENLDQSTSWSEDGTTVTNSVAYSASDLYFTLDSEAGGVSLVLDGVKLEISAVPEPSAFLFGGLVCTVMSVRNARKRRRTTSAA